jgi:hypothetical protein
MEAKFTQEMALKNNLMNKSVEKIRKEHDNERRRLDNQIVALKNIVENKKIESEVVKK